MNKKGIFKIVSNIIILLSLVFLAVYLIKQKQLVLLPIKNYTFFLVSVFFLVLGFFADGFSLMVFLNKSSIHFSYKNSLINTGRYILAKYIPGKLGIILGKAAHVKEVTNIMATQAIQKLLVYQIFALISAMLVSIIPLYAFLNKGAHYYFWIILIIISGVVFVSQTKTQKFLLNIFEKLVKKNLGSTIPPSVVFISITTLMSCWVSWSLGFYFLALGLGFSVPVNIGFLFTLAALAGIIALISPGGLGVREGVIAAGLIFYGMSNEQAISLSAFSRLWYLGGELFIFLLSAVLSFRKH